MKRICKPESFLSPISPSGACFRKLLHIGMLAVFLAASDSVARAENHGVAMHGNPELASDFTHLPYANPEAPKGGSITFGEVGTFDSLNPFIIKGSYPWELRGQTFESLLARNYDEPFSLYGLIAERIVTADDRSWVEFHLSPAARFSDGSEITVADVLWSMETLGTEGRPNYRAIWNNVASHELVGERGVRFHFETPDREAPLILGLVPILKAAEWDGRSFADTTLTPITGSGPYVVGAMEPGRSITLTRNPDYWGADLPINRGRNNLDEIRIEYFRDGAAMFEAFKAGETDVFRDGDAERWQNGYDFASAARLTKSEIPHQRPTGMTGLVFNTRNALFADRRVREALTHAFDFEWVQATMLAGAHKRIPSYFGASSLAHQGAATGAEAALLAPYEADLPPGALDGAVAQPATNGDGRNRRGLRRAAKLLAEAGYVVDGGVLRDADGAPFRFEIILSPAKSAYEKVVNVFVDALKRLGIEAQIRLVDTAQYETRRISYDFDMIIEGWGLSLSPGAEQRRYWGSQGVEGEGSRNYMGAANPAIDPLIDALVTAEDRPALEAAARALDRVLTAERYVIPFWYKPTTWLAHDSALKYPDHISLYGDWPGFLPDVWWRSAE